MKLVHDIAFPDSENHFVETLSRLHAEGSSFEYPALKRAISYLSKHKRRVAIDAGAHVGLWSRWLVRYFNFVHAFEPVKEFVELFKRNVDVWNVHFHPVALGERYCEVMMREYPTNTGQAHISPGENGDVLMLSLDSYRFRNVDLIKIDVEGYELQVLNGAQKTLLENRPLVVIEQRGCEEVNFGRKRDEALDYLKQLGMKEIERIHHDVILGWEVGMT